jgi:hypothetical protein
MSPTAAKSSIRTKKIQLDKPCFRDYMQYKYYCNQIRSFVNSPEDDRDLDEMRLKELQDYYHQVHRLWILSQKCGSYRSMFRNKCVPQNARNSAHEYEITSSLEYSEKCKRKLYNISKTIFEKIVAEEEQQRTIEKELQNIEISSFPKTHQPTLTRRSSSKNKEFLNNMKKDIDELVYNVNLSDEDIREILENYKDEEEEYFIKIGEFFEQKLKDIHKAFHDFLENNQDYKNADKKTDMLDYLLRIDPLDLATIYIDFYYCKDPPPIPSLKVIFNNIDKSKKAFEDIRMITQSILMSKFGFENLQNFFNYIVQSKYSVANNKKILLYITKLSFLYVFLEKKDKKMVHLVINNFNEIIRNFDNIANSLSILDKCRVYWFTNGLMEFVNSKNKLMLKILDHDPKAKFNKYISKLNLLTYSQMIMRFRKSLNNKNVPEKYVKTCVKFLYSMYGDRLFEYINELPTDNTDYTDEKFFNYSDEYLTWFLDHLVAFILDTQPYGKYSGLPDTFSN